MELLFLPFLFAIVFGTLGRLITPANAGTWLNGYNTMSDEAQAAFDLQGYLRLQQRFFDGLALGLLVWGAVIGLALDESWTRWAAPVTLYWVLGGLAWFTWTYRNRLPSPRGLRFLAPGVLLGALILVSVLMWAGDRPSTLSVTQQGLRIEGMYSTDLPWEQIASVDTVAEIPPIRMKINGFADGYSTKGYFKTKSGAKVKLFVRNNENPILRIQRQPGSGPSNQTCDLYYSTDAAHLYTRIIQMQPQLAKGLKSRP
jgi:hypothetical protein